MVVPSFTFAATANAVAMTGATPVFADIDPDTFCLDPDAVAAAVTARTRRGHAGPPLRPPGAAGTGCAGWPSDTACSSSRTPRRPTARRTTGSRSARSGDSAAFSFYATKNMTTGEGGMVVCRDEDTARRVRLLRNQGMEQRYRNEIAGLNNRMTDLAAAMGRVQLRRLAGWNEERRAVAATYDEQLTGVRHPDGAPRRPSRSGTSTPSAPPTATRLAARLDARGIDSAVYYPVPTHRLPAYDLDLDLPETERAAREVLSLPMRPGLTDDEVARVVAAVNEMRSDRG